MRTTHSPCRDRSCQPRFLVNLILLNHHHLLHLLLLLTPTIMRLPVFEALETRFIVRTTLVAFVLRVLPNQLRYAI